MSEVPKATNICRNFRKTLIFVRSSEGHYYMSEVPKSTIICPTFQRPLLYVRSSEGHYYMPDVPKATYICPKFRRTYSRERNKFVLFSDRAEFFLRPFQNLGWTNNNSLRSCQPVCPPHPVRTCYSLQSYTSRVCLPSVFLALFGHVTLFSRTHHVPVCRLSSSPCSDLLLSSVVHKTCLSAVCPARPVRTCNSLHVYTTFAIFDVLTRFTFLCLCRRCCITSE